MAKKSAHQKKLGKERKEVRKRELTQLDNDIKSYIKNIGKVVVPENLVDYVEDDDYILAAIETTTEPSTKSKALKKVKDAAAKSILPKSNSSSNTNVTNTNKIDQVTEEPANKKDTKQKDESTKVVIVELPKTEVHTNTKEIIKEVATEPNVRKNNNIIFDETSDRWRNKDTGKFAVSPTHSKNWMLSKVANSDLLEGTAVKKAATAIFSTKESNARKESIKEQKLTPAKTTTNPTEIETSKISESEEANKEKEQDDKIVTDKMLSVLEQIEKNTRKAPEEKKQEEKSGLKDFLVSGLATIGKGVLALLAPLKTMLGALLKVGASLLTGIGAALLSLGKLGINAIKTAATAVKSTFNKTTDKLKTVTGKTAPISTPETKVPTPADLPDDLPAKSTKPTTQAPDSVPKPATPASKSAGKIAAAKGVGKSILKKIPLFGALAGLGFGAQRLMRGDTTGAALEVASGVAGATGVGMAGSLAIDAASVARDAKLAKDAQVVIDKMENSTTITEEEAHTLRIADVEIPAHIKIVKEKIPESKPSPTTKQKVSPVSPADVPKMSRKMDSVDDEMTKNKIIDTQNKTNLAKNVASMSQTINNQTNIQNGSTSSGARVYARNTESTLEKWLHSRYSWA